MWRILLVLPSLVAPMVAAAPTPGPAPVTVPMSIEVTNRTDRIVAGEAVSYDIAVRNEGRERQKLTLRINSPRGLTDLSPGDAGETVAGVVQWEVEVPARGQLRLALGAKGERVRAVRRVALTVCAIRDHATVPVICATDMDQLGPKPSSPWWWALSVLPLAVIGAVGSWWWRRRRVDPEPAG